MFDIRSPHFEYRDLGRIWPKFLRFEERPSRCYFSVLVCLTGSGTRLADAD